MNRQSSLAGAFAHELRNALSPARAALELLQRRERNNEALQPPLRTMEKSFETALQAIDRFVEAQHIFEGTVKLDIIALNVNDVVARAVELARGTLAERGQHVRTNVDADDVVVDGDAARITQVLAQLIENASIAASERAEIEVYTQVDDASAEIVVRKPMAHAESFDLVQALESLRAPAHTQGIALATARRLMELQQGSLVARVDSQSVAAEFVMRLVRSRAGAAVFPSVRRLSADSAKAPTRAQPQTGMARRILLVDDNQAVRDIYREALEELGYHVVLAANGEEALSIAECDVPEAALIDIHLPTQNGYQLARALRARHPSSGIKLVLLSGMTLDEDMVRLSKNAGFDHCIDKGAGPHAVDALLRQ